MKIILTFFIFFIPIMDHHLAKAQWSSQSHKLILEEAQKMKFKAPTGFVSLWGGIKRTWKGGDPQGEQKKVKFNSLLKGELEYYLYQNKKSDSLNIFFPGIFGHIDGSLSPEFVDNLEQFQHSVLVIPNMLAKNYIKAQPLYGDNPAETDIAIASKLIIKTFNKLSQSKQVTSINFFAESLGTIMASGVLANLIESKEFKNLKISLTLFSPPLELDKAVANFDKQFEKSKQTYNQCFFWYRYPIVFYHFIWQKTPKEMDESFVKCLDSYLYHGVFKKGMQETLQASFDIQNLDKEAKPESFSQYFSLFNPTFLKMIQQKDPQLHLSFWLKKIQSSTAQIRIVAAKDDFLNQGLSWDHFRQQAQINKEQLILLDWGGHSGFLSFDCWPTLLENEFFKESE